MTVKETLNDGLKRGYEIKITAAELDVKVLEKLKEAQPEVEMKGFRKGKVPMAMMKKQFGPKVLGEAMQEAVDGAMNTHLETSGDRPAMQPEMKMANDEWKEGDDVVVNVSYEALPIVPDLDFSQIKLDKLVVKADDVSVQEALTSLADTAKNFEDRKAGSKAKDGDQVIFDFLGKVDGEPFEGGAAEGHALELGSGQFIPGFEEGLIGVKAGDDKKVEVTFPADYNAEHLAGKVAVFECKVLNVKEPKTSEIDDEMAKQFGAEDLAGLKGQITSKLEEEYSGAARAVTKRALLDELDKMVSFELPPSLVEAEAGQIAHQLWHEDNPEVEGHDHPEIETTEEHTKLADRRVRLGLLLAEIGQKAEIQVTDAEFTQAVMNQARQYGDQARQFFEFVQKNPQMQQQIRAPLFEDKVVDHILEVASMTEKEVSKDDLQKAVEALEED